MALGFTVSGIFLNDGKPIDALYTSITCADPPPGCEMVQRQSALGQASVFSGFVRAVRVTGGGCDSREPARSARDRHLAGRGLRHLR